MAAGDDVILRMLDHYAPVWLAGVLGAGILAAVMASDSQVLALSTMFTEDVFAYYGGKQRFGERVQVLTGRTFVVLVTGVAYVIALEAPPSIFNLAIQYAFSGFAAMLPIVLAALFWRGSTKWGALAVTLWTAGTVTATAMFQAVVAPGATPIPVWTIVGLDLITRTPGWHRRPRVHAGGADDHHLGVVDVRGVGRHTQAERRDGRPLLLELMHTGPRAAGNVCWQAQSGLLLERSPALWLVGHLHVSVALP